jgi:hypothetical protein
LPLRSQVQTSVRTFSMRLELSPHVKRVKSQRSAESRGFSPSTPVSSHRESWQGGLGKKRAHSNWHMLGCGDPAQVGKEIEKTTTKKLHLNRLSIIHF